MLARVKIKKSMSARLLKCYFAISYFWTVKVPILKIVDRVHHDHPQTPSLVHLHCPFFPQICSHKSTDISSIVPLPVQFCPRPCSAIHPASICWFYKRLSGWKLLSRNKRGHWQKRSGYTIYFGDTWRRRVVPSIAANASRRRVHLVKLKPFLYPWPLAINFWRFEGEPTRTSRSLTRQASFVEVTLCKFCLSLSFVPD